jgi:hypothetical protein
MQGVELVWGHGPALLQQASKTVTNSGMNLRMPGIVPKNGMAVSVVLLPFREEEFEVLHVVKRSTLTSSASVVLLLVTLF